MSVVPMHATMAAVVVLTIGAKLVTSERMMTWMLCGAMFFVGVTRAVQDTIALEQEVHHGEITYASYLHQSIKEKALDVRQSIEDRLRAEGFDGEGFAVTAAMTLGDKQGISKELRQTYSRASASHVLALSGMHLAIVYAILLLMTVSIPFRLICYAKPSTSIDIYDLKRWMTPVIIASIWGYTFLVGLPSSAVRASWMLTIWAITKILYRQPKTLDVIALTAFIILIADPLSIFDVGLQMSFLAVIGIAVWFSPIMRILPKRIKYSRWLWPLKWTYSGIALTISAQLFVLPLIVYYFNQLPIYGIISSLVVSVGAIIIVWCGMVAILCSIVGLGIVNSMILAPILNGTVAIQNNVLNKIVALPYSTIDNMEPSMVQIILVYIVIVSITTLLKRIEL